MFAFLNTTTFTIPTLSGTSGAVTLEGGAATGDILQAAGVEDWFYQFEEWMSPYTENGGKLPVILDTTSGPFYGYITRYSLSSGACIVEVLGVDDQTTTFDAQSNIPCRVQMHAHAYAVLSAGLVTGRSDSAPINVVPEAGMLYVVYGNDPYTNPDNDLRLQATPTNFPTSRTYWVLSVAEPARLVNERFVDGLYVTGAHTYVDDEYVVFQGLAQITEAGNRGIMVIHPVGTDVPMFG